MKAFIVSQYEAALQMLRECVQQYEEELWLDHSRFTNAAWHITYHTIFFANIYASPAEKRIQHWPEQTDHYQNLGPDHRPERTYTTSEMLAYLDFVSERIPGYLEEFDADAECWPFWYEMNQLEFQLSSLRHIQHHVGQLIERAAPVRKGDATWRRMRSAVTG